MSKRNIVGLTLLLIIVFFVFLNYILLKDTPNPIGKDSLAHLTYTIEILRDLNLSSSLKTPISVYFNVITSPRDYPPLFYIVALLMRSVFNTDFIFMTSSLFLILLIYSTYKIGKVIKDEKAGLLSVAIVSFYPIIYLTSRHFNLYLTETAMVCLTLYLLIRTECFKNRKYSVIFGFIFGIGMLSKHMFILFIIGPLFVTIVSLFMNFNYGRAPLKNLIIAFLLFSLISFIFFYRTIINSGIIYGYVFKTINLDSEVLGHRLNIDHLLFYFKSLKLYQIGLLNLIFFLFSVPIFYKKKEYQKYHLFFTLWIILPMFIFTLTPLKYSEYTISYLPALAIITSLGVLSIRYKFIRTSIIVIILISNIFLYITLTLPRYTDYFWSSKLSNTFLKHFRVFYTPASYFRPYSSKTSDPSYKAVRFLTELLNDKKSMIGFINYIHNNWTSEQIKTLLLLHNTSYEIKDLILGPKQDLDIFDVIVFITPPGQHDQWLNRDCFIQDLKEFSKYSPLSTYFLWNGIDPIPPHTVPISQKQLEKVIDYYSKVKLIQKINNILIYKKLQ